MSLQLNHQTLQLHAEIEVLKSENERLKDGVKFHADRVIVLTDRLDTLAKQNEILKTAVQKAIAIECPKYMAHPQTVWWQEHVQKKLAAALADAEKVGAK